MNFVKLLKMLGKSTGSVLRQKGAKIIPSSEKDVRLAVLKNIDEATKRIRNQEGFTIDPRTGEMVDLGEQFGFMMSPIKNENAIQIPFNPNITRGDILNAIPESYLPRLQKGGYLGGWVEDGNIYIDPAERYLTKLASLKAGLKSEQLSGANLKVPMPTNWETQPSPFFDVTEQAYKDLLLKRALQSMGATAGAGLVGTGVVKGVDYLNG
jgi:hypothetical protein